MRDKVERAKRQAKMHTDRQVRYRQTGKDIDEQTERQD